RIAQDAAPGRAEGSLGADGRRPQGESARRPRLSARKEPGAAVAPGSPRHDHWDLRAPARPRASRKPGGTLGPRRTMPGRSVAPAARPPGFTATDHKPRYPTFHAPRGTAPRSPRTRRLSRCCSRLGQYPGLSRLWFFDLLLLALNFRIPVV